MTEKNFNRTANASPQSGIAGLIDKWGAHIMTAGYTAVPDVLLANMARLGLHPPDFVLLVHLLRHWWSADQPPYPSKAKLARDIGTSEKNVQRIIGRLVKLGLLRRIERKRERDRNESNLYDFKPLIERLKPLAASATPAREAAERRAHPQRPQEPQARRPVIEDI